MRQGRVGGDATRLKELSSLAIAGAQPGKRGRRGAPTLPASRNGGEPTTAYADLTIVIRDRGKSEVPPPLESSRIASPDPDSSGTQVGG